MGFKTWAAGKQRETIFERAGGRCEFERQEDLVASVDNFGRRYPGGLQWVRCKNRPTLDGAFPYKGEAAHIFGRAKHTEKTKFDPASCIWACHDCHYAQTHHFPGVRFPLAFAQAGWDLIMADQWSEQGKREVRVALGPRPEAGEEPY